MDLCKSQVSDFHTISHEGETRSKSTSVKSKESCTTMHLHATDLDPSGLEQITGH